MKKFFQFAFLLTFFVFISMAFAQTKDNKITSAVQQKLANDPILQPADNPTLYQTITVSTARRVVTLDSSANFTDDQKASAVNDALTVKGVSKVKADKIKVAKPSKPTIATPETPTTIEAPTTATPEPPTTATPATPTTVTP